MIDLVDNIGVLIDESIDIPDIDKEDEFIISIDNDLLNEGFENQLSQIGVILEAKGGRTEASKKAESDKALSDEFDKAEKDQQKLETDAANKQARRDSMDARADRLEARGEERETADYKANWRERDRQAEKEETADYKSNWRERDKEDFNEKEYKKNWKEMDKAEADKESALKAKQAKSDQEYKQQGSGSDLSGDEQQNPGFMSAVGAAIKENPLLALGGAVIAAAGAYAVYRYMNSIYRLNKATNYYKKLASSASDPGKKAKYTEKAKMYENRLESAKAKARENKKDYIAKTKTMQGQLATMKKSGGDAKAIAKLEKKVMSRNKVLAKIGAL